HDLVHAVLEQHHGELPSEHAGYEHGRLAIAHDRYVEEASRLLNGGILHRTEHEDVITLALGAVGIVEDRVVMQCHQVRVHHDVRWRAAVVRPRRHAGESHLRAGTRYDSRAVRESR